MLIGGLAFAVVRSRLRSWSVHGRGPDRLNQFYLVRDLLFWLLVVAVLIYGAWVAPRVRIAVGFAAVTLAACFLVRRYVIQPYLGSRS